MPNLSRTRLPAVPRPPDRRRPHPRLSDLLDHHRLRPDRTRHPPRPLL